MGVTFPALIQLLVERGRDDDLAEADMMVAGLEAQS